MSSNKESNNSTTTAAARWAWLHHDMLSKITSRLSSRLDIQRFRGVCQYWRHSTPPPFNLASLMLPPYGEKSRLSITQQTIFCIEPINNNMNQAWFITCQRKENGKMRIIHPLSYQKFSPLPALFPRVLNLLDHRVREVATDYALQSIHPSYHLTFNSKVVICNDYEKGLAVMVIPELRDASILVWRNRDMKWTILDTIKETIDCENAVYHKGKVYAVFKHRRLVVIDPFEHTLKDVLLLEPTNEDKYLVSSSGDLYLVTNKSYSLAEWDWHLGYPVTIRVFKLDEERGECVRVFTLKDCVFFIGGDQAFSVSSKDFPALKANCVYMRFFHDKNIVPGMGVGIFDFDEKRVEPLSNFSGYSKIFWPLPFWIKHEDSHFNS